MEKGQCFAVLPDSTVAPSIFVREVTPEQAKYVVDTGGASPSSSGEHESPLKEGAKDGRYPGAIEHDNHYDVAVWPASPSDGKPASQTIDAPTQGAGFFTPRTFDAQALGGRDSSHGDDPRPNLGESPPRDLSRSSVQARFGPSTNSVSTAHDTLWGLPPRARTSMMSLIDSEDLGREDRHQWLSAVPAKLKKIRDDEGQVIEKVLEDDESEFDDRTHNDIPTLLILFVSVLAVMSGFIVVLVHKTALYAGCPLGINGCNDFQKSDADGYLLVREAQRLSIPEDCIHLLYSTMGALILGQILSWIPSHVAHQICGGGTVQSLVAVATGERIELKVAALRFVSTTIFLGSGGTLGMEGPAIHICTAVGTLLGWWAGIRHRHTQSLLASLGFACGFAGAFNAPIAGIVFAMEELEHVTHLSSQMKCIILLGSVIATACARAWQGNTLLFKAKFEDKVFNGVNGGSLDKVFGMRMWMLIAIPIGVICALASVIIVKSLRRLNDFCKKRSDIMPHTAWRIVQAALVSCVGAIVFRTTGLRGVWGIGTEAVQEIFEKDLNFFHYGVFACGKSLAMVLSVVMRCPGDILEPVLVSGAFIGGMVGRLVSYDSDLSGQAMAPCTIMGMVSLFAACHRFPLTPVVIVFEITGMETYAIALPCVLASFTAIVVANRFDIGLIAEVMSQDGLDLHHLASGRAHTQSQNVPEGIAGGEESAAEEGRIGLRSQGTFTSMKSVYKETGDKVAGLKYVRSGTKLLEQFQQRVGGAIEVSLYNDVIGTHSDRRASRMSLISRLSRTSQISSYARHSRQPSSDDEEGEQACPKISCSSSAAPTEDSKTLGSTLSPTNSKKQIRNPFADEEIINPYSMCPKMVGSRSGQSEDVRSRGSNLSVASSFASNRDPRQGGSVNSTPKTSTHSSTLKS